VTLPIFPLNTVLFPDGILPLRVFETRYIDMVRNCLREDGEFGVCLIRSGQEVGAPAEPEEIGCKARIVDWSMEQLGLLQLRSVGTERFRILDLEASPAGLLGARITPLETESAVAIPAQLQECTQLLRRILDQLGKDAKPATREAEFPVGQPFRLDDASWVGNRLCEFMPISMRAKQKLMELTDAITRLSLLHQYLTEHKIIA